MSSACADSVHVINGTTDSASPNQWLFRIVCAMHIRRIIIEYRKKVDRITRYVLPKMWYKEPR